MENDLAQLSRETGGGRQAAARVSTLVSVAVNVLLSTIQIGVGLFARSSALVADGVHSLSDLVADFVVLLANRYSHKEADEDHPYGHFRFETAASLVLGVLLLAVGIGMLWSSALKFRDPTLIPRVHLVALWVALIALVAKECLFRYMLRIARRVKSSMLVANAWHARSDAASSLVVALGIVGNVSGLPLLDPLAAALVGFMVLKMGWEFGYEALQDLMDRGLEEAEVAAMRAVLSATEGVVNAHDMRTRKTGDLALVEAHLLVDSHISVSEGHQVALQARQNVLARFPVADVTIHIDADHADGPANLGLPSRENLLALTNAALGERRLQLSQLRAHYLEGEVELDIFLSPNEADLAAVIRRQPLPVSALRLFVELPPSSAGGNVS
ncbi:cation diffusion facilitator family transporter [Paludibacterium yongneupense]|uniref:cation diffusion facilitator family transporter n=1 Tax=Paludibacterium yongneupense TaxID=400061 RepID=UPI0003F9669F|nr:cation diffusion facilitator family transporter [Paludibacterium yongneupense]